MGTNYKWNLDGVHVDENNNMVAEGSVTANIFIGSLRGKVYSSAYSNYTEDGDIDVEDDIAVLSSSDASAVMTLPISGLIQGQRMIIFCIGYSNTASVSSTFIGFSTITFTAQGQSVELVYYDGAWVITSNNGATLS